MKLTLKHALVVSVLVLTIFSGIVRADQLGDGIAAFNKRDDATALRILRPLAEEGVAAAQFKLGQMYSGGLGVPRSEIEAAKWWELAADEGFVDAQVSLGFAYENGLGVPLDGKKAIKWYRLAARKGSVEALFNLGMLFELGRVVPRDEIEAVKWWRLAAERGYEPAREALTRKQQNARSRSKDHPPSRDEKQTRISEIPAPTPRERNQTPPSAMSVPMRSESGVYVVPVLINNAITLDFVVDTGAADVTIPADVFLTLMRTGTLKPSDFLGRKTYVLADGSEVPSQTFRIRSVKVGDKVLENVTGSIAPVKGDLLLGQSFLGRFKSWSIDNNKHALILEPIAPRTESPQTNSPLPGLTAMEMFQKGKTAYDAKDYSEAMRWWRLAADKGVTAAMTGIANMYHQGAGVNQDFAEALRWARNAADKGDAPAMGMVALDYAAGNGVTKDCLTARQWLEKARAGGLQQANDYLRSGFGGLCKW